MLMSNTNHSMTRARSLSYNPPSCHQLHYPHHQNPSSPTLQHQAQSIESLDYLPLYPSISFHFVICSWVTFTKFKKDLGLSITISLILIHINLTALCLMKLMKLQMMLNPPVFTIKPLKPEIITPITWPPLLPLQCCPFPSECLCRKSWSTLISWRFTFSKPMTLTLIQAH